MPTIQTPLLVLFNVLILVFIFILMRQAIHYPYIVKATNRRLAIYLSLVFVLFSFWGMDWFHYQMAYSDLHSGNSGHMEEAYVFIAQKLSFNYISFRFIIWGSALLLFLLTIKNISINKNIAMFLFGTIWIIWFSYARASLSMILVYYGLSLIYKQSHRKLIYILLGFTLIILSAFFHKSALYAIAASFFVILANRLNYKLYILAIFAILLFLRLYMSSFVNELLFIESSDDLFGMSISSGQSYMSADTQTKGLGSIVQIFLEVCPYYLLTWQCCKIYFKKAIPKIPNDVNVFIKLLIFITMSSSLFLFDFGVNTTVIYSRFMRFAAIPSVIVLAYLLENKYYKKMTLITLYTALLGTLYAVIYSLYNSLVR